MVRVKVLNKQDYLAICAFMLRMCHASYVLIIYDIIECERNKNQSLVHKQDWAVCADTMLISRSMHDNEFLSRCTLEAQVTSPSLFKSL